MIEKEIKYNGVCVWWSLCDRTSEEELRQGFQALGRAELIPERIDDRYALQRALQSLYPDRRALVRPLGRGVVGYALVHEDPNGTEMEYQEELRAALLNGQLLISPAEHSAREELTTRYREERNFVTASKLGGVLVRAARALSGISLRSRGGFYWIPEQNLEKWRAIAQVVEDAHGSNRISMMRTTTDEDSVDSVCDSLIAQVQSGLAQVEEKLATGDLGKRGLRTQQAEAKELDRLVQKYEKILGRTLDSLRTQTAQVEAQASMAVLMAS